MRIRILQASFLSHKRRDPRHCGRIRLKAKFRIVSRVFWRLLELPCENHRRDRDRFVFHLNNCRAPGLEQKHCSRADYLSRVRRRHGACGSMGSTRFGNLPSLICRAAGRHAYPIPSSFASAFHLLLTSAFVLASITISSGQGRAKPSAGHLRVASIPIFDP